MSELAENIRFGSATPGKGSVRGYGGRSESGLAFAKYLPSPGREGFARKRFGMANYEGKVPKKADVAKWQTQRT
jgi:hypothetical protein